MALSVITQPQVAPVAEVITWPKERWLWLSPRNTTREFTHFVDGTEVVKGMSGRYAPPPEVTTLVVPGQPGAVVTSARHGIREFDLPLYAQAQDFYALQALLGDLAVDLDAVAGSGILRHVTRDNQLSDLHCRCISGPEIQGEGANGPRAQRLTLIFQAYDPYWYGQPIAKPFTVGAPTPWFPILPLRTGSSSVLGPVTIDAKSDVDTYPLWVLTGPAEGLIFVNYTTGQTLSLTRDLLEGEVLTIDTRPGMKTVTGPNDENWRRYLDQRSLWPLASGLNDLDLSVAGATPATRLVMTYWPLRFAPGRAA